MDTSLAGGLDDSFWARRPLIGMVHLQPLPGSPRDTGDFDAVLARADADARALVDGGADAILVENFFDAPFARGAVPPHTIAALTRAALTVRAVAPELPLGINCLRNDALGALAVAVAVGARFVRINVFVGAAVTDQGIIEGAARDAVLYRRQLGADVALLADIFVKHAAPLGDGSTTLEDAARDAVRRGLADALIVSGTATGAETSEGDVARVAGAVPEAPILVGSGFDTLRAPELLAAGAVGAIVGTALKEGGRVEAPVDRERVRALKALMRP
jgi:membrane complex biogenesis BtpA family protein